MSNVKTMLFVKQILNVIQDTSVFAENARLKSPPFVAVIKRRIKINVY